MRKFVILGAVASVSLAFSGPASANHHEKGSKTLLKPSAKKAGKTLRKPAAKTTKRTVMIDGKEVPVCTATVKDGCVNPREAGLKWGNQPLDHWPDDKDN